MEAREFEEFSVFMVFPCIFVNLHPDHLEACLSVKHALLMRVEVERGKALVRHDCRSVLSCMSDFWEFQCFNIAGELGLVVLLQIVKGRQLR